MVDHKDLDCTKCGVCCIARWSYIALSPEDYDRIPRKVRSRVTSLDVLDLYDMKVVQRTVPSGPLKGKRYPVCAAFRGGFFDKCGCSIYEHRPSTCREFDVGEKRCLRWREMTEAQINRLKP